MIVLFDKKLFDRNVFYFQLLHYSIVRSCTVDQFLKITKVMRVSSLDISLLRHEKCFHTYRVGKPIAYLFHRWLITSCISSFAINHQRIVYFP